MKTMTCRQLGGACEEQFTAETFKEIAQQSREHGMEMFQKGDAAHIQAMEGMQELMSKPGSMETWIMEKEKEFNELQEN